MILYAATIFLGAFLLFLVQPIIAKQILPWFGGAAAVWATCLVFFQSVLLLGYAYSDWIMRRLAPRRQARAHIALLVVSLLVLPIIPDARWKPGVEGGEPTFLILGLLAATIGLPYFLLSTTSPLVQAWYWQRYRNAAPYRLFALSNFASLLALLCYPVAVEPFLALLAQSWAWSAAYAGFVFACCATAYFGTRRPSAAPEPAQPQDHAGEAAPTIGQRLLWVVFSALGSCLLLAVTNHLTQNIASIPFLWVVPLSIYLVSFILCFDHPRWYRRGVFLPLTALLLPVMAWQGNSLDLWIAGPLYTVGLFACCMFCHGELTLLRPGPRHLTTFYLMVSFGGAVGALLVGVGAPYLLSGYYELGITLTACAVLLYYRTLASRWWVAGASLAVVTATAALTVVNIGDVAANTRVKLRNFYGVVRTRDYPTPVPYRVMYHGGINHGGQFLDADKRGRPTSYFAPTSGYGRAFASLPKGARRVGVIGLGAGALAAYARRGDRFRFYEIDPQVAAIAVTEFTYLRDSPAQIDIVLGDGRLSLEREPAQSFDLLAIDAFSGDAIPMHLLTRDAMATYVRHLNPDGVIVFQATNRYVDIAPVVERLAAEFGMEAVLITDLPDVSRGEDFWTSDTDQILVTRNARLLASDSVRSVARPLLPDPGFRVFTDDFHNLFRILRR